MGKSNGIINLEDIKQEDIEAFYNFLQGKDIPSGIETKHAPHLSRLQAFSIIYYLQEVLRILPDKFERCTTCGRIFNAEAEGDGRLHCDDCMKDY